jgi:hypothetical protein
MIPKIKSTKESVSMMATSNIQLEVKENVEN